MRPVRNASVGILILIVSIGTAISVAQSGTIVSTGTFYSVAHGTRGRATVYSDNSGARTLRLTHFKTSNGPKVHVVLLAATDTQSKTKLLDKSIDKVELGPLKGTEGDQNYEIPADADLGKFSTVTIYCEQYNVNFGSAHLRK